jgi:hypothetical protein
MFNIYDDDQKDIQTTLAPFSTGSHGYFKVVANGLDKAVLSISDLRQYWTSMFLKRSIICIWILLNGKLPWMNVRFKF